MAFKLFNDENVTQIRAVDRKRFSISIDSESANSVHFFTGIKSLGKINFFDTNSPPSFALTQARELKYVWDFDQTPIDSLTAERTVGAFIDTTASETYQSSTNNNSGQTHQSLYNYTKGYLYRADNDYVADTNNIPSVSIDQFNDVARIITLRRDLKRTSIEPNTFRLEVNLSNTSTTGVLTDSSSLFTTALDIKNPTFGNHHSFAGVRWTPSNSLDSLTSAMTIEAIIRPYKGNSVIFWKRLSSSGWAGSVSESQNSFIKLELAKSADNRQDAFRLYIRSVTGNGDFAEDFAKRNVQASGLFVPGDVGINLYDGRFHHIIVSWGVSGQDGAISVESGAGSVFGYIDGFKLLNREQTEPRLGGSDSAGGPTIQANMFNQRYPIKTNALQLTDIEDGAISGNNAFIGVSNFKRELSATGADRGELPSEGDPNLEGGYDGQIQHLRIWNERFDDGTSSVLDGISRKVNESSTAGISFLDFQDATLTGGAATSGNLVSWWNFNELSTLSAADGSQYSNTATFIGNAITRLYDHEDISRNSVVVNDQSYSGVNKTYLYFDRKEDNVINNGFSQGRIIRHAADGQLLQMGLIYYDLGIALFDRDDNNARLEWLFPASGTTGDFGFSTTGILNAALNIERLAFVSNDSRGRTLIDAVAEGDEFNYSENITSIDQDTNEIILDDPATYFTTVLLHNDENELLAVGKLSVPVRKDQSSKLIAQIKLDF